MIAPQIVSTQVPASSLLSLKGERPRTFGHLHSDNVSADYGLGSSSQEGHYEFQVAGMIELGQKLKPKKSLGLQTKPNKTRKSP